MKQVLGCFGALVIVLIIFLVVFEKAVVKPPASVREDTPGDFSTPESALETYIWAYNQKDYFTYLECLGKPTDVKMTSDVEYDVKLWGQIYTYNIQRQARYADLVQLQVLQDYESSGGDFATSKFYHNQRQDYYFVLRDGRWVYLPEGLERTVVMVKNFIWGIWDKD